SSRCAPAGPWFSARPSDRPDRPAWLRSARAFTAKRRMSSPTPSSPSPLFRSSSPPSPFSRPSLPVKLAVTVAVVGLMGAMRLGLFGHRIMPIAFGMALIVFLWLRDRRLLWITVAIFAATTVFKSAFGPVYTQGGEPAPLSERLFDMALVLLDLFVIAAVVHVLIGAREKLERKHDDLIISNEELAAREEEITRQNEELQSQTEELESQSEELLLTNVEMASRELMLETLM